jgi:hypothetical protein
MALSSSWNSLQSVWMMSAMYSDQLNFYSFLKIWLIDSTMVILTLEAQLVGVNHNDTIMAVHITCNLGILLISNPYLLSTRSKFSSKNFHLKFSRPSPPYLEWR